MAPRGRTDREPTDTSGAPVVVCDAPTRPYAVAQRLICVAGPDVGRTFRIDTPSVTVGRGTVDVALTATDISRNHARLFRRGAESYAIEDLGSANKTYVNGQPLTTSVTLRPGDRIQVGETVLVFAHYDELEERMQQLQNVEGLATFAAGIAHDFNNALSVILGGIALVEHKLQGTDALTDVLADMHSSAARSSQLAFQLMQLGRGGETPDHGPIEVSQLVHRTTGLMRRRVPKTLTITNVAPEGLVVRGLEAELHLVLMNLILNARDAMPGGGSISITVREVTLDAAQTAAKLLPGAGDYVELVVKDTGSGMDAETKARAFEPFFTTKPPGRGTGLGLAMVHGILSRHGGAVAVESAVGAGSTFTIWLPALA